MRLVGIALRGAESPIPNAYVPIGGRTGLLGPNDVGKSRLLQRLARVIKEIRGSMSMPPLPYPEDTEVTPHQGPMMLFEADAEELKPLPEEPEAPGPGADDLAQIAHTFWMRDHAPPPDPAMGWGDRLSDSERRALESCLGRTRLVAMWQEWSEDERIDRQARAILTAQLDAEAAQALARLDKDSHYWRYELDHDRDLAILVFQSNPAGKLESLMPMVHELPVPPSELAMAVRVVVDRAFQLENEAFVTEPTDWESEGPSWLTISGHTAAVHQTVEKTLGVVSSEASRRLPDFVSSQYRVKLEAKAPSYSTDPSRVDVLLEPVAGGDAFPRTDLADGYALWVDLAILEACSHIRQVIAHSKEYGLMSHEIVEARPRSLYILDEPERHLHPGVQRNAANWLRSKAIPGDAAIVMATHTPLFMPGGHDDRLLFCVDQDTAPYELSASDDLAPSSLPGKALGLDHGQLLAFAKLILWVEGETDLAVLRELYGEDLDTHGIMILPLGGFYGIEKRLTTTGVLLANFASIPFAVWLDNVPRTVLTAMQQDPENAKAIAKKKEASQEAQAMGKLITLADQRGIVVHPLPHPESDVLFLIPEEIVRSKVGEYPGHEEAKRIKAKGKDVVERCDWSKRLLGSEKDPETFARLAERVREQRTEIESLKSMIAECRKLADQSSV